MVGRSRRFQRSDRLLSSSDFRRIGRVGKRLATRFFVVLVASAESQPEADGRRLGVTVSRRVGNSVVRNRIKRGVREWFRLNRSSLPLSGDFVVIARRDAATLSAGDVAKKLNQMLPSEARG